MLRKDKIFYYGDGTGSLWIKILDSMQKTSQVKCLNQTSQNVFCLNKLPQVRHLMLPESLIKCALRYSEFDQWDY